MPSRQKNTPANGRNPKAGTKAPDASPVSWWNLHDNDFFGKHRIQLIEAAYLLHYEYSRTHTGILADVHRLRAKIRKREEGEPPATQFDGFRMAEFWKSYYPEFPSKAYWEIPAETREQRLNSFGLRLSDNPYLPPQVASLDPSAFAAACARGELPYSMSGLDRLRYMVLQIDPFRSDMKVAKRILELVRERQKAMTKNLAKDPALLAQVQAQHGESRGKRWNKNVILVALKELGVLRLVREFDWDCGAARDFADSSLPDVADLPYLPILARWERACAHALALMQRLEVAWKHVNHPFLADATSKVDDHFFFRWLVAPAETQASAYNRRAHLRTQVGTSIARHRDIG